MGIDHMEQKKIQYDHKSFSRRGIRNGYYKAFEMFRIFVVDSISAVPWGQPFGMACDGLPTAVGGQFGTAERSDRTNSETMYFVLGMI